MQEETGDRKQEIENPFPVSCSALILPPAHVRLAAMSEAPAVRLGLGARLRAAIGRVLREHASPARLGFSVALGVLIGCTPFFGLQTVLALGLAWALGLNRVAVVTASQISFPPLTPLLVYAAVQVGALVLQGHFLRLGLADFRGTEAMALGKTLLGAWTLGSLVVGAALGAVLGGLVAAVVRARRGPPPPEVALLAAARRRAAARFAAAPPRARHYVAWKYRLDPGYAAAAVALADHAARPGARICDLGCGHGLLALLLKEAGARAAITALDWDAGKLALGRAAAAGLDGIELREADLTQVDPPRCDAAALIDVLHYHPPEQQDALLGRVAAALAPGGRLVIREVDAAGGMRAGRALERFAARLGWHRTAGAFRYRPAAELAAALGRLGLTVAIRPAGGLLTRANVLLVADRPAT
jgi:uncharacterized protein (DUF2062 family)/SAM-dependent methyltransferase